MTREVLETPHINMGGWKKGRLFGSNIGRLHLDLQRAQLEKVANMWCSVQALGSILRRCLRVEYICYGLYGGQEQCQGRTT